jgi:hypothetical protein
MIHKKVLWFLIIIVLLLSSFTLVFGQSGGGYDLSWHTIAGGGGTSSGGNYTAASTIGQPAAGHSSGGTFEVSSGFWAAFPPQTGAVSYTVYLPGVLH